MEENQGVSTRKQIRNFLFLMSASTLSALVLAISLILYYSPSENYAARDALLSPEVIALINYNDTHPNTGAVTRFVFDSIELSFFDHSTKRWKKVDVDLEHYKNLYTLLSQDKSISPLPDDALQTFNTGNPATLTIRVRPEKKEFVSATTKVFQHIVFASQGNDYRIQLREGQKQDSWAYFNHPGIYQRLMTLMIPQ